jgi:hypothetical protein
MERVGRASVGCPRDFGLRPPKLLRPELADDATSESQCQGTATDRSWGPTVADLGNSTDSCPREVILGVTSRGSLQRAFSGHRGDSTERLDSAEFHLIAARVE